MPEVQSHDNSLSEFGFYDVCCLKYFGECASTYICCWYRVCVPWAVWHVAAECRQPQCSCRTLCGGHTACTGTWQETAMIYGVMSGRASHTWTTDRKLTLLDWCVLTASFNSNSPWQTDGKLNDPGNGNVFQQNHKFYSGSLGACSLDERSQNVQHVDFGRLKFSSAGCHRVSLFTVCNVP